MAKEHFPYIAIVAVVAVVAVVILLLTLRTEVRAPVVSVSEEPKVAVGEAAFPSTRLILQPGTFTANPDGSIEVPAETWTAISGQLANVQPEPPTSGEALVGEAKKRCRIVCKVGCGGYCISCESKCG